MSGAKRITLQAPVSHLRLAGRHLRQSGDERLAAVGCEIAEALRPGGTPMPWCVWCAAEGRRRRASFYDLGVPCCVQHDPYEGPR